MGAGSTPEVASTFRQGSLQFPKSSTYTHYPTVLIRLQTIEISLCQVNNESGSSNNKNSDFEPFVAKPLQPIKANVISIMPPHWKAPANGIGNMEAENANNNINLPKKDLLRFIQPPEVLINVKRIGALNYQFDVSESGSLNKDGVIANVQWDFDYRDGHFTSTQGYTFLRDKKTGRPVLVVEYECEEKGEQKIGCSVQDDQGGERTVTQVIEVR